MTSDRDFAEADSLWEFVTDPDRPATSDLERTVRRVQRATDRSTTMAPRDTVWDQVMASTSPARPASPSRAATGLIASGGWARQQVGRWQSVVSFGLVLMFLASLLIVAHDRVISPALATATPTASDTAGMVPLDATPGVDGECVAREVTWQEPDVPPVRTPAPQYEAKQPAPREIGEAALETYLTYMICLNGTTLDDDQAVAAANTYRSASEADINEMLMGPGSKPSTDGAYASRDDEITQNAIIPVNRPVITYTDVNETGVWSDFPSFEVFWPTDVYELIDGRYGVVIGSVSTDSFRQGSVDEDPFSDGTLTWVAFVEQDGQVFIDEIEWFCTGDWVHLDPDGNEVATPVVDEATNTSRIICR